MDDEQLVGAVLNSAEVEWLAAFGSVRLLTVDDLTNPALGNILNKLRGGLPYRLLNPESESVAE